MVFVSRSSPPTDDVASRSPHKANSSNVHVQESDDIIMSHHHIFRESEVLTTILEEGVRAAGSSRIFSSATLRCLSSAHLSNILANRRALKETDRTEESRAKFVAHVVI